MYAHGWKGIARRALLPSRRRRLFWLWRLLATIPALVAPLVAVFSPDTTWRAIAVIVILVPSVMALYEVATDPDNANL